MKARHNDCRRNLDGNIQNGGQGKVRTVNE